MIRYFRAQYKRLLKFYPFVFALTLILFVSMGAAFRMFQTQLLDETKQQAVIIGIAGDTKNEYFQLGLQTLSAIDSSRFTVQIIEFEEEEAKNRLLKGEISAYVVIPEGFMEEAMHGELTPIKYVTGVGSTGLTAMFKDEITEILKNIVLLSQNGIFALEDVLTNNGLRSIRREHSDNINFEYIDLAISRVEMYQIEYTGVSAGVSEIWHTACGIVTLFFFLSGIVYALIFVRKDSSLVELLASRGRGFAGQIISEFAAFFLTYVPVLVMVGGAGVLLLKESLPVSTILSLLPALLLGVALSVAFNLFLFEVCDRIVTGVLLQFVTTLFMCYVTGCLYPVYSLPEILQKIAPVLPTGTARVCLENAVNGNNFNAAAVGVVFYILLFLALSYFVRCHRARRKI